MWTTTMKMAWRNLGRNRRRTLITAGAIGFGLAGMLVAHGFNLGMNRHLLRTATLSGLGHAQIHAVSYRQTHEAADVIPDAAELLASLTGGPIAAATPRAYVTGLAAVGDRSSQIDVIGIDLEREPRVTNWHERLVEGTYPQAPRDIALGQELAERLEVEPGSRIVITATAAGTGEMTSILAHVSGLLLTDNPAIDQRGGLMPLATVQSLLELPGGVHEITLRFALADPVREKVEPLLSGLRRPGIEVVGWYDLFPALSAMKKFEAAYMSVLLAILFVVAGLGVVNTMNMALLERLKEFGLMRALGTSPRRLGLLVTLETVTLGLAGAALGVALWAVLHAILSATGISFGEATITGVSFRTPIRPVVDPVGSLQYALLFILLAPLAGLPSSIRAGRIQPARALRDE